MTAIHGRDSELSNLAKFLERLPAGPRALALIGEPGIGKTTLWGSAVDDARGAGYRVLVARPSEAEAAFPYAALSDLLGDGYLDVESLPELQRHALDVATLKAPPTTGSIDQRTVAAATLAAVRGMSGASPVLIAVDDAHWLDGESTRILGFAVRRLQNEPVGILTTSRSGEVDPDPVGLGRAMPEGALERLRVDALPIEAAGTLITDRIGIRLPRSVLRRIHDESRGNPLLALELARVVAETGIPSAGEQIPAPADLRDLLRARLSTLPDEVRDSLLLIAAMPRPSLSLAQAASDASGIERSLRQAVHAGLVEIAGDHVRFTHPLFASAAYADASDADRRAAHRRLAETPSGIEERARHLALASTEPDLDAVAALEKAADAAAARGAPAAAADLLELAFPLLPPDEAGERRRLQIAAADHHFMAGDQAGALTLLRNAVGGAPPGEARAETLLHLGRVLLEEDLTGATEVLTEALATEAAPARARALAAAHLSTAALNLGDLERTESYARREQELAEEADDPSLVADALAALALAEAYLGRRVDHASLRRAEALWEKPDVMRIDASPRRVIGELMVLEDRLDEARLIFTELRDTARDRGDELSAALALGYLVRIERHAGRWDESLEHGRELAAVGVAWGGLVAVFDGLVLAHRGRFDTARPLAEAALEESRRAGYITEILESLEVLGVIELLTGDAEAAFGYLSDAWATLASAGAGEPTKGRFVPDLVEASIRTGRLAVAEERVAWLEERGRALERPRALATGARCRGQLAFAHGDVESARRSLERAVDEHERLPDPLELGRTLLALGAVRRRAKQKRGARDALERARTAFEELGAEPWVARTTDELSSIGGRPAASGALTPTEARVAALAASGNTNREIANSLIISERTVAGHLSHVYGKLGVRSRTELVRVFDDSAASSRAEE